MTEMPVDVLNHRLGKLRDNGDIDFDNTAVAVDIDTELQEKFLFFPIADLEAKMQEVRDVGPGTYHLGDGPEKCSAQESENPTWLLNHAENALALYWKLMEDQKLRELEEERRAKRPEPGIYQAFTEGEWFTVLVTDNRRMLVQQQNGGLKDLSSHYDEVKWMLQRINTADGTVQA